MSTIVSSFQKQHSFQKRVAEAERILKKFPDRIPVIVERNPNYKNVPQIDKQKYLVPCDLTAGQFVYIIRKRINLSPEQAIFIFINNFLPPTSSLISTLYETHKSKDGFLYMTYSGENTFGGKPL